jgi:hypothetical protein
MCASASWARSIARPIRRCCASLAAPSDIDPKVCATDNFSGGPVLKR